MRYTTEFKMDNYLRLCCSYLKKEKRDHVIFDMFPPIFKSELFLNNSNEMINYLCFCGKYLLFQSINIFLLGVE